MSDLGTTYEQTIGALVVHLAKRNLIVKIGIETGIIGGDTLILQVTRVHGGKTQMLKEMLNYDKVVTISDPKVVADAIYEKMRKS